MQHITYLIYNSKTSQGVPTRRTEAGKAKLSSCWIFKYWISKMIFTLRPFYPTQLH